MEVKQINQLMLAMGRTGIKKLVIKRADFEVQLEREDRAPLRATDASLEGFEENPLKVDFERHHAASVVATAAENPKPNQRADDLSSAYVTSPMVGTFYPSPSPQDPPFIKVGDTVDTNTVVCIVEAMKVMNEVKAGVSGTVAEALIEAGHAVEFGTKIFRIIPT